MAILTAKTEADQHSALVARISASLRGSPYVDEGRLLMYLRGEREWVGKCGVGLAFC